MGILTFHVRENVRFYLKTDNDFYIKYDFETTITPTYEFLREAVKEAADIRWDDILGTFGFRDIKHKHKSPEKIYITHTGHETYEFKYKNWKEFIKEEKKELSKELGCKTIELISEEEYKAAVE